ncbi:ABC transporter permease subunit [Paraburkholderia sp. CNPSo 3076]|uniref:ABC transporter permease n=1 Tax=Paraburkholderia sp. CNPSo 3076 TaxID=2940936 RepID=UPI002257F6BA|nr:ABC transporter permease subunit [Paraburkholderia sp. CNPSo 3076]MCX5544153.1 ABC transporter permease subunit [Paraburkholderia sp. CNPSo 3076]
MNGWHVIIENSDLFVRGFFTTLLILAFSALFSIVLSIPFAFALNSNRAVLRIPAKAYTMTIRGFPALIQLFMVYYGLSQFDILRDSWMWRFFSSALFCTLLVFTLNTVAYTGEIFAGALHEIPRGEIEAGASIGMSAWRLALSVQIPLMLRKSLPQYNNEIVLLLHATALASAVTLLDLTGAAQTISMEHYVMLEPYLCAAAIYFLLTAILMRGFKFAERRWLAYLIK